LALWIRYAASATAFCVSDFCFKLACLSSRSVFYSAIFNSAVIRAWLAASLAAAVAISTSFS